MRYLSTILPLILFAVTLLGKGEPVMLKIIQNRTKINPGVLKSIRAGVEDQLTFNHFTIISMTAQEAALKEQAEQRKKGCYDDNCLVATGKMLAARELFVLEISNVGGDYLFKLRMVDLESGETKGSSTDFYQKDGIASGPKSYLFAKKITAAAFQKRSGTTAVATPRESYQQAIKLTFRSEIKGISVKIDGKFVGKTPTQVTIPRGRHTFNYTLKNYQSQEVVEELYIDTDRTIKLEPVEHTITFKAEPGVGITTHDPGCDQSGFVVRGDYGAVCFYLFKKEGYYEHAERVTFNRNQTIEIKLKKIPYKTIRFKGIEGMGIDFEPAVCGVKNGETKVLVNTLCNWRFSKRHFIAEKIKKIIKGDEIIEVKLKAVPKGRVIFKSEIPVKISCVDQEQKTFEPGGEVMFHPGVYRCEYRAPLYQMEGRKPEEVVVRSGEKTVVHVKMLPDLFEGLLRLEGGIFTGSDTGGYGELYLGISYLTGAKIYAGFLVGVDNISGGYFGIEAGIGGRLVNQHSATIDLQTPVAIKFDSGTAFFKAGVEFDFGFNVWDDLWGGFQIFTGFQGDGTSDTRGYLGLNCFVEYKF